MKKLLPPLLLALLGLSSCDDVELYTASSFPTAESVNLNTDPHTVIVSHDSVLSVSVVKDKDLSSKHIKVKKMTFYWDGREQNTDKHSPYTFTKDMSDQSVGDHTLRVRIRWRDHNLDPHVTNRKYTVSVAPSAHITLHHPDVISNGEVLTCTTEKDLSTSNDEFEILAIAYYWDNTLITTLRDAPYALSYPIEDVIRGDHRLTVVMECSSNGHVWSVTHPERVSVE